MSLKNGTKILFLLLGGFLIQELNAQNPSVGKRIDSLNGVYVYENGPLQNISGRRVTKEGYNIGLKYQCVEFVKRYYLQHLNHKMPNSYGNAVDYFNENIPDGTFNQNRGLIQYSNPSRFKPKPNDILIFNATPDNPFGHVGIISWVKKHQIEIIQQNPPQSNQSARKVYDLIKKKGRWEIKCKRILGRLRKEISE